MGNHILDHIGFAVSDMTRAKAFYSGALEPLGITLLKDYGVAAGFGKGGKPELWMGAAPDAAAAITPVHVCLSAASRAEVEAFYAAAIAAGGRDNGAPGLRPQYHPNYYGAFVLDPDGHNVEGRRLTRADAGGFLALSGSIPLGSGRHARRARRVQ